jgi:AcrR family transcriptional regulator
VGQGTYYKLYGNREACLREAFERCANTILAGVEDAAARAGDDADRLEAGLGELLALLEAHPDVARLLLVGILAGDDRCREARERWLGRLARLFASGGGAGDTPPRGSLAWLAAGAVASVLSLRLEANEPLPQTLGELVRVGSWFQGVDASMRVEGATGDEELEPVEAAPRRRDAARTRTRAGQRKRILAAMSQLAGARGYRAVRMTDLLAKADVSGPLFYTHFRSKEECLLAAFDAELAPIEEQVAGAVRNAEGCARRAESGLGALLGALAAGPWRARLVTVEIKRRPGKKGSSAMSRRCSAS